jgi:hypothetical protein
LWRIGTLAVDRSGNCEPAAIYSGDKWTLPGRRKSGRSGTFLRKYHRSIRFPVRQYLDISPNLPAFRVKVVKHFLPEGYRSVISPSQSHTERILIIAFSHFLDSLINGISQNGATHHLKYSYNSYLKTKLLQECETRALISTFSVYCPRINVCCLYGTAQKYHL